MQTRSEAGFRGQNAILNAGIGASIDKALPNEDLSYLIETTIDEFDAGVGIVETLLSIANSPNNNNSAWRKIKSYLFFWKASEDTTFKEIVKHIYRCTDRGYTLSEAVNQLPKAFPEHFRALVMAAETSGRWTTNKNANSEEIGILNLLLKQLEREGKVRSKVKSATRYPAFIFGFTVVIVLIFAFTVLPKLKDFFDALDIKNLNFAAKTMLTAGDFINHYYSLMFAGVVLATLGAVLFWRSYGKTLWQKYQFSLPLIGQTVRNITVAEIFCLFSTLQDAGIIPEQNLSILAKVSTNKFLQQSIEEARTKVLHGKNFSESLGKSHEIFGDREYNLLVSAEKSGTISSRPLKHAEKLFRKAEDEIDQLIAMIQPIMLIVVGVIIGFMVIGFYSAFFGAIGQFASH